MYYRQKFDCFIRNYDGIGYITSTGIFCDRVVDKSGAVFLCALSRQAQTIEELSKKIASQFKNANYDTVLKDATEFYDELAEDGFVVKGETPQECDENDKRFSYKSFDPKTVKKDFSPKIDRADTTSQEYLEKHFNGKPHLTSFQIELTSRCNERCVHCYIPHEYKLYDIKDELYYSVLDQLSDMGVLNVTLSGGEPMLHPHFLDFLKAAQKKDFVVNILSNLTLLNDEIIAEMKNTRLSSVQVSLYSMNAEHHDAITTVRGSFEKTKASILKLIENDIPLQISCPIMQGNKNDYAEVLTWAHAHKVRAVTDYIMMAEYNHETKNLANRLTVEEAGDVIKSIMAKDVDYQNEILKPDFVSRCNSLCFDPERRLCGVGISSCCMVANGNIYPCAGWQECVCGNVAATPLKQIWEKSEKFEWLRGLRMKDLGGGECCRCEKSAFCTPCLVRNANESKTGDPLEINRHFCRVAEVNKKIVLDWRQEHIGK